MSIKIKGNKHPILDYVALAGPVTVIAMIAMCEVFNMMMMVVVMSLTFHFS